MKRPLVEVSVVHHISSFHFYLFIYTLLTLYLLHHRVSHYEGKQMEKRGQWY